MNHRPRLAFLIVLLVPVVAAIVLASALFIREMSNDPPPPATADAIREEEQGQGQEQEQEPTTVSSNPSPDASGATPEVASGLPPAGSLTDLMQYAPDRLRDGSLPLPEVATYTNIDAWLTNQGLTSGSLNEQQAASLALPPILAGRGLDPIWESNYGFSLADVDQVLTIGQAPDYIMIMRGRFDAEALTAAWTTAAYQAVAVDGTTVWSVYPFFNDTIDLSKPASQPAMGSLNNLVLLDDGTLIASTKLPRLQHVLRVLDGNEPSLARNADIAELLSMESADRSYVSAVIAKGDLLESAPADTRSGIAPEPSPGLETSADATPGAADMPRARMCLFGTMHERGASPSTPESTPDATGPPQLMIALVFAGNDAAETARPVIASRFQSDLSTTTGMPFTATWTLAEDEELSGSNMTVMQVGAKSGTLDWTQVIDDRDFGFLTWNDDDDS